MESIGQPCVTSRGRNHRGGRRGLCRRHRLSCHRPSRLSPSAAPAAASPMTRRTCERSPPGGIYASPRAPGAGRDAASPAGRRSSSRSCATARATSSPICSMENIDPVGVHTGDSIVVAPTQTLANKEYQMLRTAALDIISALEIEGGCNVPVRARTPTALSTRSSRSTPVCPAPPHWPVQGHRLSHRQGGRQDRAGLHAGRDPQRRHRQDHRLLRAHAGLLRAEDPPPGPSTSSLPPAARWAPR